MRLLVDDLRAEWRQLDAWIAALDGEFARMGREHEAARRLAVIPGIGVINATALVRASGGSSASFVCFGTDQPLSRMFRRPVNPAFFGEAESASI